MSTERIKDLAIALGFDSAYNYNATKVILLEYAIENATLLGKLEAIAEYEGLGYAADQELHITKAGHEVLATEATRTIIDNGIRVDVEALAEEKCPFAAKEESF